MTIDFICNSFLDFLRQKQYRKTTLVYYKRITNQFRRFCRERKTDLYTTEIGKQFSEDVLGIKTGEFNISKYHYRGRLFRVLDSFYKTGQFDISAQKRRTFKLENQEFRKDFHDFKKYIVQKYPNESSQVNCLYSVYYLLEYLTSKNINNMDKVKGTMVLDYLKTLSPFQIKDRLRGFKLFFELKKRKDLIQAIEGIHCARRERIVPMLSSEERKRLFQLIEQEKISAQDSVFLLLGLHTGIRACDAIKLKLSNIDWIAETFSFTQSKTGNPVTLPLTTDLGNAIVKYIQYERPKVKSDYLFLRKNAPFEPLSRAGDTYRIIQRAFKKAGIEKGDRIIGMHMLRHNAASTMVRNEIPLETISAILGHSSPKSTGIYITTDEEHMSACVLPFVNINGD